MEMVKVNVEGSLTPRMKSILYTINETETDLTNSLRQLKYLNQKIKNQKTKYIQATKAYKKVFGYKDETVVKELRMED